MSTTETTSSALAQRAQNPGEEGEPFAVALERQTPGLEKALARIIGQDVERFKRSALTLFRQNPKLQKCTPTSLLGGMMEAAQLGLEFGVLGHAYLVPYRNSRTIDGREVWLTEAQFIPGYRGLIELHLRTGKVNSVIARPIYEKDTFEVWDDEEGDHYNRVQYLGSDRGEVVRYYGRAMMANGTMLLHVMEIEDIERHKKSAKGADTKWSPWVTNYDQMALKTVIKDFRWLPTSVEVAEALHADEQIARLVGDQVVIDGDVAPELPERSGPITVTSTVVDTESEDTTDSSGEPPESLQETMQRVTGTPVPNDLLSRSQGVVEAMDVSRVKEVLGMYGQSTRGSEKALKVKLWIYLAEKAHNGDVPAQDLLGMLDD